MFCPMLKVVQLYPVQNAQPKKGHPKEEEPKPGKQCTQRSESLNEGGAHEINPNWKDFSPVVIAAEFLPIWEIDSRPHTKKE